MQLQSYLPLSRRPRYSGSITGEFLPDDHITHTNRYALYIQHNQKFGNGFGGYIYYNKVSDNMSSGRPVVVGQPVHERHAASLFQQEAGLTCITTARGRGACACEQHWQTLTPSVAPYGREPQLNVKYAKYNIGGFDFGAEADYSDFRITTADLTEAVGRVMFNPYLSYSVVEAGLLRHAEGAVALRVSTNLEQHRQRSSRPAR